MQHDGRAGDRQQPGPRRILDHANRQDGRPAILVAAKLEDGLQVDAWASDIRAALAEFETGLPGGMDQELVFDQSTYTADRLAEPVPVSGGYAVFGTLSLALEPASLRYAEAARQSADAGAVVCLDPNIRPGFIKDVDRYRDRLARMLRLTDTRGVRVCPAASQAAR